MITILHTNDFHDKLTEAQAGRLRLMRAELAGNGLLFDAGDAVASGNVTFRVGGELVHDLMNSAGYDVSAVGNREFHFSRLGFQTKLSRAEFPHLCANVVGTDRSGDVPTKPYHLFTVSGKRIFAFGLTVPMITERMLSRKVSSFVFAEPVKVAEEWVSKWREEFQPDLVVAITHIGLSRDRVLAERVGGIDLIIGGHSHDRLEEGERIGDTLIVQTGCYGKAVGAVEIDFVEGRPVLRSRLEAL